MLFVTLYTRGNILHTTEPKQFHNQLFSIAESILYNEIKVVYRPTAILSVLVRGKHLMVLHLNNHIVKTLLLTC